MCCRTRVPPCNCLITALISSWQGENVCVCVCVRARACVCTGGPHSSSLIDHGQALPYLPIPTTIPHSLHPAASSKAQTKLNSVLIPKPFPLCPTCCVLKQRCREGTILMTDRMTLFPNFIHPCSTPESRSQCFENCCTKERVGVGVGFFFLSSRERARTRVHTPRIAYMGTRKGRPSYDTRNTTDKGSFFVLSLHTHVCCLFKYQDPSSLSLPPPHPPPAPAPSSLSLFCLFV